mmetsp:Transcript_69172/g.193356  ORF Transcript_69172/g.193356 Transcript_69172/m.193356 type:complete len:229 (-) Transcript_69172:2646-3332(-)
MDVVLGLGESSKLVGGELAVAVAIEPRERGLCHHVEERLVELASMVRRLAARAIRERDHHQQLREARGAQPTPLRFEHEENQLEAFGRARRAAESAHADRKLLEREHVVPIAVQQIEHSVRRQLAMRAQLGGDPLHEGRPRDRRRPAGDLHEVDLQPGRLGLGELQLRERSEPRAAVSVPHAGPSDGARPGPPPPEGRLSQFPGPCSEPRPCRPRARPCGRTRSRLVD